MIDFYMWWIDFVLVEAKPIDVTAWFIINYIIWGAFVGLILNPQVEKYFFKDKPNTSILACIGIWLLAPFFHIVLLAIIGYILIELISKAKKEWK